MQQFMLEHPAGCVMGGFAAEVSMTSMRQNSPSLLVLRAQERPARQLTHGLWRSMVYGTGVREAAASGVHSRQCCSIVLAVC